MNDEKTAEISFVIKSTFAPDDLPPVSLIATAHIKDSDNEMTDCVSACLYGELSEKFNPFPHAYKDYDYCALKVLQFQFNDFFDKCLEIMKREKK
jgi:hypothetical protein